MKEVYKRIVCISLLFVFFVGFICLNIHQTQKQSIETKYEIKEQKVKIGKYELKIPQFVNMADGDEKQKKLNSVLINEIEKEGEKLEVDGVFEYFEYSIECQNDSKLSVLFQYDYYNKDLPHPLISAFAVNIDIINEKMIGLTDSVKDKKDIGKLFKSGKLEKIVKNNHGIADDNGYLGSKNREEILLELGDHSFYITDNGIGFIFGTTYAVGSYMIYECSDQSVLKADFMMRKRIKAVGRTIFERG